jgi:N-acetylglucosamine-6-phosphate deacetylase
MHAMGLPEGRYTYNNLEYESKDGTARYKDGTLIGTALGLNQIMARLRQFTRCSLPVAIKTITENPAQVLGLAGTVGGIVPRQEANLVLLDDDLTVCATIVAGRLVYQR